MRYAPLRGRTSFVDNRPPNLYHTSMENKKTSKPVKYAPPTAAELAKAKASKMPRLY